MSAWKDAAGDSDIIDPVTGECTASKPAARGWIERSDPKAIAYFAALPQPRVHDAAWAAERASITETFIRRQWTAQGLPPPEGPMLYSYTLAKQIHDSREAWNDPAAVARRQHSYDYYGQGS